MPEKFLLGKSILIVEDNLLVGHELRRLLEGEGGVVVGPVSSEEVASWAVGRMRFDGALLDVVLRQGTAAPVALRLRQQKVPFVVVSAHHPETIPVDMRGAPFVGKPYRLSDVLSAIESALGGPGIVH